MRRRNYGDWLLLCFVLGVISGTAAANLFCVQIQDQASYLGKIMEAGSRIGILQKKQLFLSVIGQRFLETGIFWLISLTVFSAPCFLLLSAYSGLSVGMMLSVFTCHKGLLGLPLYLSSVFPQYLFYFPVWVVLARCAVGEKQKIRVSLVLLATAILLVGVWSEVSINPYFLRIFL